MILEWPIGLGECRWYAIQLCPFCHGGEDVRSGVADIPSGPAREQCSYYILCFSPESRLILVIAGA